jgi:hypothetical protein
MVGELWCFADCARRQCLGARRVAAGVAGDREYNQYNNEREYLGRWCYGKTPTLTVS